MNHNNTPLLSSVLRAAAREVTGANIVNQNIQRQGSNYARIKTAHSSNNQVNVNQTKLAQVYAGGNINITQPNFYSPFLTPSSFQIPNTRKEVYLWANWWRNNEPKVAAAINFYTNFPFSGWTLTCQSSVIKDYFEKLVKKLNLRANLPKISMCYHLYGDVFVVLSLECPHCGGSNVDENGELCKHDSATWKSLSILNPDSIMITPGFMDQEPTYSYLPSEKEIKIVTSRDPIEIYNAIPDEVKILIAKKQPIKLNPICVHHFKHAADPWADYGTSLIRPLFPTLAYKDKLRQAMWLIAERHILPIKHVKVGSDARPANQNDIDNVQDQMAAIANDPNLTLVTHHAFEFAWIGASGKFPTITEEFTNIDQEILDGVMLNKALLNGEGPTYGNAQVGLIAMAQRLETWRNEIAHWIEENIFKPVSEWNAFTAPGPNGEEEVVYPSIQFDDLKLKDETGRLQTMVTAQSNGVLSAQTLVEALGLNWDQEVERLRFEKGSTFVDSPDIANTDIMGGFTPQLGGGTPGMPGMPGAPPMGGMPGAPPMGGAEMGGGMPGMSMPPPGAPPPPTFAANKRSALVKLAIETTNSIYHDQEQLFALKGFKKEASKQNGWKILSCVNGRGSLQPLDENIKPEKPYEGEYYGFPLNYYAVKEVIAKKKKNDHQEAQPQYFTEIERSLYKILLNLQIPIPFYAQYIAGPDSRFQIDAAFPNIKLGIEADGSIWHNGPDQMQKDQVRDNKLAAQGWSILRFTDKQISDQPAEVSKTILDAVQKLSNGMGQMNTL